MDYSPKPSHSNNQNEEVGGARCTQTGCPSVKSILWLNDIFGKECLSLEEYGCDETPNNGDPCWCLWIPDFRLVECAVPRILWYLIRNTSTAFAASESNYDPTDNNEGHANEVVETKCFSVKHVIDKSCNKRLPLHLAYRPLRGIPAREAAASLTYCDYVCCVRQR